MLRYATCLLPALALLASAKDPNSTVLNEWPMVMVHDAATTYLEGGFLHQVREKECCVVVLYSRTSIDCAVCDARVCGVVRAVVLRPRLLRPLTRASYSLFPPSTASTQLLHSFLHSLN